MKYTLLRFVHTQPETMAARSVERAPASEFTLDPRHSQTVEQLRGALA